MFHQMNPKRTIHTHHNKSLLCLLFVYVDLHTSQPQKKEEKKKDKQTNKKTTKLPHQELLGSLPLCYLSRALVQEYTHAMK